MRTALIRRISPAIVALLLFSIVGTPMLAASSARLEGRVVGLDGRAVEGYRVHLIDDSGSVLANSGTQDRGVYSFQDLSAGSYSLGIENGSGQMAPVAGPAIRVENGQLARRDLKLLETDLEGRDQAMVGNYGMGAWWGGLTGAAKAWSVIAVLAVAGITASAVSDDNETPASATVPTK